MSARAEEGQALPLLLLALLLAGATMLALARLGVVATHDARARTAADAAALAGAAEGAGPATALASANGGRVVAFDQLGDDVRVDVEIGDRRATAQARAERPAPAATGGAPTSGLTPAMIAAIGRAEALLGQPIPIVSGWRSRAQQQRLWDNRAANPYPVARPGTSNHERGIAIDVARGFVPQLRRVAAAAGLCFPLPVTDPVHFELCR